MELLVFDILLFPFLVVLIATFYCRFLKVACLRSTACFLCPLHPESGADGTDANAHPRKRRRSARTDIDNSLHPYRFEALPPIQDCSGKISGRKWKKFYIFENSSSAVPEGSTASLGSLSSTSVSFPGGFTTYSPRIELKSFFPIIFSSCERLSISFL